MEKNDVIAIKNSVGLLKIKLIKRLKIRDVNEGMVEEMKFNGSMRLEVHKNDSVFLITLTERFEDKKIIVLMLDKFCDVYEAWLGEMQGTETKIADFETVY